MDDSKSSGATSLLDVGKGGATPTEPVELESGRPNAAHGAPDGAASDPLNAPHGEPDVAASGPLNAAHGEPDVAAPGSLNAAHGASDGAAPGSLDAAHGEPDGVAPGSLNAAHGEPDVAAPGPLNAAHGEPDGAAPGPFNAPHGEPDEAAPGPLSAAHGEPDGAAPGSLNAAHGAQDEAASDPLNAPHGEPDQTASLLHKDSNNEAVITKHSQSSDQGTDFNQRKVEQGNTILSDQQQSEATVNVLKNVDGASAVSVKDGAKVANDLLSDDEKRQIPTTGKGSDFQKSTPAVNAGRGRLVNPKSAKSKETTSGSFKRFSSGTKKESESWKAAKERYMNMALPQKRLEYRCGNQYCEFNATNFSAADKPAGDKALIDKVAVWRGDITSLEFDAIVNAANERMRGGGGVDGAIHSAAGPYMLKESIDMYPHGCKTGEAKVTGGYQLPARYVIHTVGPRDQSEEKLTECYKSVLNQVVEHDIKTVAIPCISTGIFGYPNDKAAMVALKTVRNWLKENQFDGLIVFCVFLDIDNLLYNHHIPEVFGEASMDTQEPADMTSHNKTADVTISPDSVAPEQSQQAGDVANNKNGLCALFPDWIWGRCNIL